MAHIYPLVLDVSDRLIVIVGGGEVAVRKAQGLLAAGAARVRVVAPKFHERMPEKVQRVVGNYLSEHLNGADLVFAATDDVAVNDAIVRDARRLKILVCRADVDQNRGDFATPAMIRRGPILLTVSTGNSALTARLRKELEAKIDTIWDWIPMAELMTTLRLQIQEIDSLAQPRRREIFLELASDEAKNVFESRGRDGLIEWLKTRYPELASLA